jgi:phosphomevalonate kinase
MDTVRVPGKVMLSGEYAVLDGATAVLLPVSRSLQAEQTTSPPADGYSPVVSAAREIAIPAIADHEAGMGVVHLRFDRSELVDEAADGTQRKLGLGMSAAEAVATIALRYEYAGIPWLSHWRDVAKLAMDAHRRAQQGIGSGADIAACAYGRPLRFRRAGEDFTVEDLPMTAGGEHVPLHLAWTGQPADTRDQVRRYLSWREQPGAEVEELWIRLLKASEELAQCWFDAGRDELHAALDRHGEVMNEISAAAGLSYRLPVHARLEAWAKRHGGRAKPTGAGAGDMVLLVGDLPLNQLGEMLIIPLMNERTN